MKSFQRMAKKKERSDTLIQYPAEPPGEKMPGLNEKRNFLHEVSYEPEIPTQPGIRVKQSP